MPITPTDADIGRRVIYAPASKAATVQDQMHGVLMRLWDGIPYIKYDWQPEQAPPIAESPSLLSWDDAPPEDTQEADDDDLAALTAGDFVDPTPDNEALSPDDEVYGEGANEPAASSLQGEGGEFGGGGASADFSEPTTDSDSETETDNTDSGGDTDV